MLFFPYYADMHMVRVKGLHFFTEFQNVVIFCKFLMKSKFKQWLTVSNSTNINKTNTSYLKPLNTKKTMTYTDGNTGTDRHKNEGNTGTDRHKNEIPILPLLLIRSPIVIQIYKKKIKNTD